MKENPIKVASVEDVAGTREALASLIAGEENMECVATAASGEIALRELPALRPHVVLMDIQLPGINGSNAFRN